MNKEKTLELIADLTINVTVDSIRFSKFVDKLLKILDGVEVEC